LPKIPNRVQENEPYLRCFQGRGVSGSTGTLSILAGILGETGSGPVLEPVSRPVLEPVLKSVHGEFG